MTLGGAVPQQHTGPRGMHSCVLGLARVSVDVPKRGEGHPEKDIPSDAPTVRGLSVGRAVLHSHGGTFSITGAGMWHHCSEQLLSVPTDEDTAPGNP